MKENLRESLKRYSQLLEYNYHVPEDMDVNSEEEVKKILGEEDPEEEVKDEEGGEEEGEQESPEGEGGEEEGLDDEDMTAYMDDEEGDMGGEEEPALDEPAMGGGEDEDVEEIDVTELVKYSEEAKDSAEESNEKVEQLINKFSELQDRLSYMDQITQKVEDLEKEIEKRNPTDKEQLEMRSFQSYPYNQKLTDYWSEKTGYEATDDEDEMYDEANDEYVLRVSDVENDYSETSVRKSLEKGDPDSPDKFPPQF